MVFLIAAAAAALVGVPLRRIPAWAAPVAGALLVMLLRYETPYQALDAVARQWNVLLFILGLMGLSAAAEHGGAFEWITAALLERARGSARSLFVLLFVAGALVTLLLSNDATAIGLTPIVYRSVKRVGADVRPFLFAGVFVANTASFGLPFSNPANVLILPHARLLPYAWHLGPPQVAAIALNLAILLFFFRSQLRGRYAFSPAGAPAPVCARTIGALLGVGLGYVAALIFGWPLGIVAAAGAAVALAVAGCRPAVAARHAHAGIFVLLAALFVLLDAVTRAGFAALALRGLDAALQHGALAATASAAFGAALLANAFNNLPVAVAASYVVAHAHSGSLAYALVAGVDLGPNLLTSGSLATILWLAILRRYGVRISIAQYAALGAVIVPTTLGACVLWLWLTA